MNNEDSKNVQLLPQTPNTTGSSHTKRASVADTEDDSPRKRQRGSPTVGSPKDVQPTRKGRACAACRKLKVKCDASDRGAAGCSRCQRLGMECINARRLRITVDGDDGGQTHPVILRLERAIEDVLEKLRMPSLETYGERTDVPAPASQPQKVTTSEFLTTRENSREPVDDEKDIAPAPMGSLYEVTQLNSLRSRLRYGQHRRRNNKRRMEADLVSENLISEDAAEEMLLIFKTSLSRYLFDTVISEDISLSTIRESSTILFTAIMLVSALHIPGKETVHATCHKKFLELVSVAMFDRFHTLDDIRGLCIAAFWQPDLSWKLSGLCIRMATELNLHHAFYKAFYTPKLSDDLRRSYIERARVWYLLYVLDHHFSIAYGRPPVTAELLPIKECDVLLNSPWCTPSDRRLLSQVTLFVTLSKAYEVFGLEPDRTLEGDDASLLTHMRSTEGALLWRDRWKDLLLRDKWIGEYPAKGVLLHHGFAELVLNSLALRGRPLERLDSLPANLRPLALRAVEAAHFILRFVMEEHSYREGLVGIPLYLHSMIAFAAVFLMKLAHRWQAIGIVIDPEIQTKPLIEGMIRTLRDCKAGANHMVFSMASGLERILKKWDKDTKLNGVTNFPGNRMLYRNDSMSQGPLSLQSSPADYTMSQGFDPNVNPDYFEYPTSSTSGGWGAQDDMLWSVGMGYDLLASTANDFADFPLSYYTGGHTAMPQQPP